jgi:primosomal protein N'
MQANIVIVGATRGFETLTYLIAPKVDGFVLPGPLISRNVTVVVTEVGEPLSTSELKPILEVLEPRPLFDRAHLQLMEFLATYYMVSIADAYRSVIPAVARVESRTAYNLGTPPNALARATFTRVERTIIEKIAKGAATTRQLEKVGPPSEVRATIARFVADGIIERRDATTGRHRDSADFVARLVDGASVDAVRGSKQREVLGAIANAGATGLRVRLDTARARLAHRPLKILAVRAYSAAV